MVLLRYCGIKRRRSHQKQKIMWIWLELVETVLIRLMFQPHLRLWSQRQDIVSQCMVAGPMVLLYFVSIILSGVFYKPKSEDDDEDEEDEDDE